MDYKDLTKELDKRFEEFKQELQRVKEELKINRLKMHQYEERKPYDLNNIRKLKTNSTNWRSKI